VALGKDGHAYLLNRNDLGGIGGSLARAVNRTGMPSSDGLDGRDTRAHNYPLRWNAAPSQELLVIQQSRLAARYPHGAGQLSSRGSVFVDSP
jgi:hypothetical protein